MEGKVTLRGGMLFMDGLDSQCNGAVTLWDKKGLKDRRDCKLTLDYCRQQSQPCSCWSHCRKPGPGLFHPFCWKRSCDCWRLTLHDNTICAQEMGAIYNIPPPRLSWSSSLSLSFLGYPSCHSCYRHFYRTRIRSLAMLVSNWLTHWLTHWLLFSKLDWCDPGMWRWQLKLVEVVTVAHVDAEDRVGNSFYSTPSTVSFLFADLGAEVWS